MRWLAALSLILVGLSGCVGRLIADKGMSDSDRLECDALVRAVKNRVQLSDFRIPPGLDRLIGTMGSGGQFPRDDLWPEEEPRSIACGTEVRGVFLTLNTVVGLYRVADPNDQDAIVALVQERRKQLVEPKPTLVRFLDREVWLVHRDISGKAYGYGRGKERILRDAVIR